VFQRWPVFSCAATSRSGRIQNSTGLSIGDWSSGRCISRAERLREPISLHPSSANCSVRILLSSPPRKERMSSPYTSQSSSLANLSNATSASAPVIPTRTAPAGTLPPGTPVTVGKHNVTIERWLSEGNASKVRIGGCGLIGQVDLHMSMLCD